MTGLVTLSNGREMEYDRFGAGDSVFVIIPGISLRSIILSAPAVESAFSKLAEKHTVFLFDRVKHAPEGYTVEDIAADTAEALKILGIDKAVFYGASQGGMVCRCLAEDYPELVIKVIFASSAQRPNKTSHTVLSEWDRLAHVGDCVTLADRVCRDVYSPVVYEQLKPAISSMFGSMTKEELRQFIIMVHAADIFDRSAASHIACPALVVGAEGDRVTSVEASYEIAQTLGCKQYIYGNEYGHAVYDEAPDFIDRMISFIG